MALNSVGSELVFTVASAAGHVADVTLSALLSEIRTDLALLKQKLPSLEDALAKRLVAVESYIEKKLQSCCTSK